MHSRLVSDSCLSTGGNGVSPALSLSLTRRHFLAKMSFPSKTSNGAPLFLIWNKTKPWCLHLLAEDYSLFWAAASGHAQIRGEMVSVKCSLHSHFHSQPWPYWKPCSSPSRLNLFILCPKLFPHDKNLLGRSVRELFSRISIAVRGVGLSSPSVPTKPILQCELMSNDLQQLLLYLLVSDSRKISPFPYKSICGIFVLTGTSEIQVSVLSLPLQTGNYLLWCGLWQNAISFIQWFVFSLLFCLLYVSTYFYDQHLIKPGADTDDFVCITYCSAPERKSWM